MSGSYKDYYIDVCEELYGEMFDRLMDEGCGESEAHRRATIYAEENATKVAEDRMADMADYYMDMALGK